MKNINIDDNEDETDSESVSSSNRQNEILLKSVLPYKKLDIELLKNDVLNH